MNNCWHSWSLSLFSFRATLQDWVSPFNCFSSGTGSLFRKMQPGRSLIPFVIASHLGLQKCQMNPTASFIYPLFICMMISTGARARRRGAREQKSRSRGDYRRKAQVGSPHYTTHLNGFRCCFVNHIFHKSHFSFSFLLTPAADFFFKAAQTELKLMWQHTIRAFICPMSDYHLLVRLRRRSWDAVFTLGRIAASCY